MLWEECAAVGMPRAVVVTKLDKARADFDETGRDLPAASSATACCRSTCRCAADDGTAGRPDRPALRSASTTTRRGSPGRRASRTREHLPLIEARARNALIEGIIAESEDETLMDRYLGGEDIDIKVLIDDLETAVARGSFYPVLPRPPRRPGSGTAELLEVITAGFPVAARARRCRRSPAPTATRASRSACDPDGPLVAEVVKTTTDPYVGRISLVRVFSGTLRPDATVHVSGHCPRADRGHEDHDVDERVGALSSPLGKTQRTVAAVHRRRHLRGRQADPRRDRRHAVRQGPARC